MTATEAPKSPRLRYDDPRLLLTISQAAFELDRAARQQPAELRKASAFFDFLAESISSGDLAGDAANSWVDPISINVVTQALKDAGTTTMAMQTVHDVFVEAMRVVRSGRQSGEEGSKMGAAELRDFCVAFGNSLLAWRAQHSPQPIAHPYRK